MKTLKSSSISFLILLSLIFFQGISGIYGGGALVLDPSGRILNMPVSLLDRSPFESYFIPGIILFSFLGIFPLIVFYGLVQGVWWSRLGSILVGTTLIIWIGVEISLIGYHSDPPLQLIYGLVGVALLALSLMPSVQTSIKSKANKYG